MSKDKNQSAFPEIDSYDDRDNDGNAIKVYYTSGGMTLRDYFAAKAMNGWLSSNPIINSPYSDHAESGAKIAYEWADAMLKERMKYE